MRLDELFNKPIVLEAEGDDSLGIPNENVKRTVKMSVADLYMLMGKEIPRVKGAGRDTYTVPDEYLKQVEYEVGEGEGQINPKLAAAHTNWTNAGRIPGALMDPDTGELVPWKSNSYLLDLGLAVAAGGVEAADAITKGTAGGIDGVMNFFNVYDGKRATDFVDGETTINDEFQAVEELSPLAAAQAWIEDKQSKEFQTEVELTSGAVDSWGDALLAVTGNNSDISMIGILGIMSGELAPEVLDMALIAGTSWWSGGSISVAMNTAEAAGAAMNEIRSQINGAYNSGLLQQQPQWKINHHAAKEQLTAQGFQGTDAEFAAAVDKLALDQTVYSAHTHGLLQTAAAGGIIDSVTDKLMYKGPIGETFLGNAFGKAVLAPVSEGVSEAAEQYMTNVLVIDAAGDITTRGADVLNAAYNGIIAGNTSTALAAGVGSARVARAQQLKLRRFFANGRTNIRELVNILAMDPATLSNYVKDPESGELRIDQLVKDRGLVGIEDLTDQQLKSINRRSRAKINIGGRSYTKKQLEENQEQLDLIRILQNGRVDNEENMFNVTWESEDEVRKMAATLGIETAGKGIVGKGRPINDILADLERVKRIDVRIVGRSDLEAPTWNDLTQLQKVEFVDTGTVEFVNDPERGNQKWTREQVLRSSRSNQESVPSQITNLVDNVDARPTMDPDDQLEINSQQALIDNSIAMTAARRELEADQKEWDAAASANGSDATIADLGPRPSEDMEGDPYNFTGARASTSMSQTTIDQIKKNLANAQAEWDKQYSATHNTTGVARLNKRFVDPNIAAAQDQVARDNQDAADAAMGPRDAFPDPDDTEQQEPSDEAPEVTTQVDDLPDPGDVGSDLARGMVVTNAKIMIANGQMDPISVEAYINKLEKSYPGITQQVMPDGIESYKQNPEVFKDEVSKIPPSDISGEDQKFDLDKDSVDAPELPQPDVDTDGPDALVQPEYNAGETVTYKNAKGETRDAEVVKTLPNGNIQVTLNGATYALTPEQIQVATQAPDTISDPGKINTDLDVSPQTLVAPDVKAGDNITYRNKKGETRDAEVIQTLPNGNVQVTLNGATFALTPAQIAAATLPPTDASGDPSDTSTADFTAPTDASGDPSDTGTTGSGQAGSNDTTTEPEVDDTETEPSDDEVFDPSAATPIDQQFADVEVPQSVKDDYAEVLATQNGIKIMQFLDGLPPEQAGSLRVNTPRPGQDGDANDETPATTTTDTPIRPDALDLPSTSRPDTVADPSQTPPEPDPATEPDDGDIPTTTTADSPPPGTGTVPVLPPEVKPRDTDTKKGDNVTLLPRELPQRDDTDLDPNDIIIPTTPQQGSGRGDGQAELDARREKARADQEAKKAELDARREKARADQAKANQQANDKFQNDRIDRIAQQSDDQAQADNRDAAKKPKVTTTAPEQPVVPDTDTTIPNTDTTTDKDVDTTTPKKPAKPDQDTITVPDDAQTPPESEITKKDDENTADEIDKLPVAPPPSVNTTKNKQTFKQTVKTTTKKTKKTPRVGAGLIGDFGKNSKSPPNILPYIPPPPQDDPLDLGKWKRYK